MTRTAFVSTCPAAHRPTARLAASGARGAPDDGPRSASATEPAPRAEAAPPRARLTRRQLLDPLGVVAPPSAAAARPPHLPLLLLLSGAALLGGPAAPTRWGGGRAALAAQEGITPRKDRLSMDDIAALVPEQFSEAARDAAAAAASPLVPATGTDAGPATIVAGTDASAFAGRNSAEVGILDVEDGFGPTPRWGQLLRLNYKIYTRNGGKGTESVFIAESPKAGILMKHGNGRTIRGLEVGLHSMKAGGRRRLFIPKELGYLDGEGLGPVPSSPFRRKALGDNLDKLSDEGALVFDVTVEAIMDDEMDLGYYDDLVIPIDQVRSAAEAD